MSSSKKSYNLLNWLLGYFNLKRTDDYKLNEYFENKWVYTNGKLK